MLYGLIYNTTGRANKGLIAYNNAYGVLLKIKNNSIKGL